MNFENHSSYRLLENKLCLINLIQKLISNILRQTQEERPISTVFNCKTAPNIAIGQYLKRIAKYSHCSNSAYVIALIYIDRLQERIQNFILNKYCVHRVLICAVMVAVKYIDDFYYKNQYYAKIGGITRQEIDELELQMMLQFNFSVFISQEQFINYLQKLQTYQEFNS